MSEQEGMSSVELWAEFDEIASAETVKHEMWKRRLEKADAWYLECREAFWEAQNKGYSVGDIENARERLIRAQRDIDNLHGERRRGE